MGYPWHKHHKLIKESLEQLNPEDRFEAEAMLRLWSWKPVVKPSNAELLTEWVRQVKELAKQLREQELKAKEVVGEQG